MPLELPVLDDRRYADLVAEARRLIPVYDTQATWTNHNPSDPGITCIELFAYLTEMLLYRVDRVTAGNQRKFLKLLNGPEWTPGTDLATDIRATVLTVRERERAATAADFERLSTSGFQQWLAVLQRAEQAGAPLDEWWRVTGLDSDDPANLPSTVPSVARAQCAPSRNLDRGTEPERTAHAPGHVSVIVLPNLPSALLPSASLRAALWGYLDERRILTMRHHVVGPHYAPISAEMVVAGAGGTDIAALRDRIVTQLTGFLDRLTGGAAHDGWPFGRDVYVSELFEQIETVEGVDYITDLMLSSACRPEDVQCAEAASIWHPEGDQIGMALSPHHMPLPRFDPASIVVVPNTAVVHGALTVVLSPQDTADPSLVKRQTKAAVRDFFHPLHHGPKPGAVDSTDLNLADLKTELEGLAGVSAATPALQADPARLLVQTGQIAGLHVEAGEIVNMHVRIIVEGA
jgi:hypothetical protein